MSAWIWCRLADRRLRSGPWMNPECPAVSQPHILQKFKFQTVDYMRRHIYFNVFWAENAPLGLIFGLWWQRTSRSHRETMESVHILFVCSLKLKQCDLLGVFQVPSGFNMGFYCCRAVLFLNKHLRARRLFPWGQTYSTSVATRNSVSASVTTPNGQPYICDKWMNLSVAGLYFHKEYTLTQWNTSYFARAL